MLFTRAMPSFDFGKASGEMANAAAVKPVRRRNLALLSMGHPSILTGVVLRQPPHHRAAGRSTTKLHSALVPIANRHWPSPNAKAATFESGGFVVRQRSRLERCESTGARKIGRSRSDGRSKLPRARAQLSI